ncbi:hypothetical protein VMCG_04003 [Cytospora schulzeri]|uniref:2EXR domain-containing protein n=1 Tax=Cytospora schulzeri TaxID=448051 RepID=A0A423WTE8_9PEZI|nr:hypothetical protein VMCG_04003 [Valsa malicola]
MATELHRFPELPGELKLKIWKYAAREARGRPRVYYFGLFSETQQLAVQRNPNGQMVQTEARGPLLCPTPQLRRDTQDQRGLLMACTDSRRAILQQYTDMINFTRRPQGPDRPFDPSTSPKYPLYFDANRDIICLPAQKVVECKLNVRDMRTICSLRNIPPQMWSHDVNRPEINWPLWRQIKNIAIDISYPLTALHENGKVMDSSLHAAITDLLYHDASMGPNNRLFLANLCGVQYDNDGQPTGMTVVEKSPRYESSLLNSYVVHQGGLTLEDMWLLLDEARGLRRKRSSLVGLPPCLLVRSQNGTRFICIEAVVQPDDDDEEDWDDEESDQESE